MLADYYRLVDVDPTNDRVKLRGEAVDVVVGGANHDFWIDCVRFVLGREPTTRAVNELVSACRASDSAFPTRDNRLELEVVAAAAVAQKLESPGQMADVVAYALLAGHGFSFGKGYFTGELVGKAASYALVQGHDRRTTPTSDGKRLKRITKKVSSGASNPSPVAEPDEDGRLATVQGTLTQLTQLVTDIADGLNRVVDRLNHPGGKARGYADSIDALREEVNILWWLFGETSVTLGDSFSTLTGDAATVVLPCELVDLLELLPAPAAVSRVLRRALSYQTGGADKVTAVDTAMRSLPTTLENRIASKKRLDLLDLTPLHAALDRLHGIPDGSAWQVVVDGAVVISSETEVPRIEVATQLLNELLFYRTLSELSQNAASPV